MPIGVKMVSKGGVSMADDKARFTLRIPQELYTKLKDSAEVNKRSVIKEIEYILERHYDERDSVTTSPAK
jgi:hypothetical protein